MRGRGLDTSPRPRTPSGSTRLMTGDGGQSVLNSPLFERPFVSEAPPILQSSAKEAPLMHANVRFEHQLLAVESEHTVNGMLELQAPPAPEGRPGSPFHLALVIDRSGSMAGSKLEVTRECCVPCWPARADRRACPRHLRPGRHPARFPRARRPKALLPRIARSARAARRTCREGG